MKKLLSFIVALLLLFGIWSVYGFGQQQIVHAEELPSVGTVEHLKTLLKDYQKNQRYVYRGAYPESLETAETADESVKKKASGFLQVELSSDNYSTTNIQVEGVDEGDIVKTDGRYIYQINQNQILVVDTQKNGKMEIADCITFDDRMFFPQEMYIKKNNLIVIGRSNASVRLPKPVIYDDRYPAAEKKKQLKIIKPPEPYGHSFGAVYIKLYDITNKKDIREVREIVLEGRYVASRRIKDHFYLIANHPVDYSIMEHTDEEILPGYKDTLLGEGVQRIDLKDIQYFPKGIAPNYITIMALDVSRFDNKADIYTYLGQGDHIYASLENLYIAVDCFEENPQRPTKVKNKETTQAPYYVNNTQIYKFQLNRGKVSYKAKGKVPGRILNQFSMDEHDKYFRIATTTGEMWRSDEYTSKNNVYILDQEMRQIGKLEGIAPTERIYAMRFMGDRGYMVTFRQTDPFFVIDLKEPKNPQVLGYLKIPGYSDYLHPYDENHIIGFGKEVIEWKGNSFQAGMKVAIFDVRDVNHPVERFKTVIGDQGTDSILLRDHKALLFSKEKNLLAFPVTVMEEDDSKSMNWGKFTFQGAYVYNLDLKNGLRLKGKITHLSEEDYTKAGNHWYHSNKNIKRILYIGNTLYTLSNVQIKAHDIYDMKPKDTILLNH